MSFHYQLESGAGALMLESGTGDYLLENFQSGNPTVRAVRVGYYLGVFRDIGDVFLIFDPNDFSDSTVPVNLPSDPDYPFYGWMLELTGTPPLVSYALASQGASSPKVAATGTNAGGQRVYGNAERYVW